MVGHFFLSQVWFVVHKPHTVRGSYTFSTLRRREGSDSRCHSSLSPCPFRKLPLTYCTVPFLHSSPGLHSSDSHKLGPDSTLSSTKPISYRPSYDKNFPAYKSLFLTQWLPDPFFLLQYQIGISTLLSCIYTRVCNCTVLNLIPVTTVLLWGAQISWDVGPGAHRVFLRGWVVATVQLSTPAAVGGRPSQVDRRIVIYWIAKGGPSHDSGFLLYDSKVIVSFLYTLGYYMWMNKKRR